MDIRMPQLDGLTCLDLIKKRYPNVKVVFLSAFDDPKHIQAALKRGAAAYIVKSVNPLDLASTLRRAVEGTVFHGLGLPQEDEHSTARSVELTDRELAILRAGAKGLSNQAIGKELRRLWLTGEIVVDRLLDALPVGVVDDQQRLVGEVRLDEPEAVELLLMAVRRVVVVDADPPLLERAAV